MLCLFGSLNSGSSKYVFISYELGSYIIGDIHTLKLLKAFGIETRNAANFIDILPSSMLSCLDVKTSSVSIYGETAFTSRDCIATVRCMIIIPVDGYFLYKLYLHTSLESGTKVIWLLVRDSSFCGAYSMVSCVNCVTRKEMTNMFLSGRLRELIS